MLPQGTNLSPLSHSIYQDSQTIPRQWLFRFQQHGATSYRWSGGYTVFPKEFFSKVLCISKHRLRGQCFPHHFNSNGFEIIHRPIKTQEVHTWINFKTSWNDSSKYGRNSFLSRTEKSNIETLISKERFQSDFMGVGQRRNSESFVMIRPTDLTSHRELV